MKRPDTTLPLAEPISLPALPEPPRPAGFPLAASLAPVVVSVALWLVTQSLFALVFAALGPVVAVAGVLDGKRQARKRRRLDAAQHAAALENFRAAVVERHRLEREAAWWATPSARQILASVDDPLRWRDAAATLVSLGSGAMPSTLPLRGAETEAEADTARWARTLEGAPVTAAVIGGIGVVGPPLLTRAYARALVLQLAHALPPDRLRVVATDSPEWEWMGRLPHCVPDAAFELCVVESASAAQLPQRQDRGREPLRGLGPGISRDGGRVLIALSGQVDELPPGCHTVVRLRGHASLELLRWPGQRPAGPIVPELVSAHEASAYAGELQRYARSLGVAGSVALPGQIGFADLEHRRENDDGSGDIARQLRAVIGQGVSGPAELDLVADGPHAIVAGTTGSGKSELLITWVLALASRYAPECLSVLLVDFKGGAAFTPLLALPHCVGLITDLDEHEAQRALDSLAAELRHRERVLREHGARDIAELPAGVLARLVIVVDEFAAMLDLSPLLHSIFVDLAARGRSLGIHLVLCTQRPAGVVRDALAANCALRLSFRVNNRGDSAAVIGGEQAASLDPSLRGRAYLAGAAGVAGQEAGHGPSLVQVALATTGDIAAVVQFWAGHHGARRPWLESLPVTIPLDRVSSLPSDDEAGSDAQSGHALTLTLGLADEPREQRHTPALYRPSSDGSLMVVGAAGAGKTALLRAIEVQCSNRNEARFVSAEPELAWDVLGELCSWLDRHPGESGRPQPGEPVLLLDDVDSLLARCPEEYLGGMRERLERVLRDGPRAGLTVVVAARRPAGTVGALHALCGSTLILAMPSRQEHQLAGGELELYEPEARPGAAVWRGLRTQIAWVDPSVSGAHSAGSTDARAPAFRPRSGAVTVVVSRAAVHRAAALRAAHPDAVIRELGHGPAGELPHGDGKLSPSDGQLRLTASGAPAGSTAAQLIVGDPEAWQAEWALLGSLRRHGDLVFERVSLSELRMLSGIRTLPPLLAPVAGRAWLIEPGGNTSRVQLDSAK